MGNFHGSIFIVFHSSYQAACGYVGTIKINSDIRIIGHIADIPARRAVSHNTGSSCVIGVILGFYGPFLSCGEKFIRTSADYSPFYIIAHNTAGVTRTVYHFYFCRGITGIVAFPDLSIVPSHHAAYITHCYIAVLETWFNGCIL